jgi:hypothetical protein
VLVTLVVVLLLTELALHFVYRTGPAGASPAAAPAHPGHALLSYGDSIGHAYQVDWNDGYPQVLERLLDRRDGDGSWAVRTSQGYSPSKYAARLRADLDASRTEAVIVEIELSNDVSDEALLSWQGRDADGLPTGVAGGRYLGAWDGAPNLVTAASSDRLWERTRMGAILRRGLGALLGKLSPNPVFADGADTYYYNLSFDRYLLTRDRLEQGWAQMFRALDAMNRLCKERHVRFLLMILPSSYWFEEGSPYHAGARRLVARAEADARALAIPMVSPATALSAAGGPKLFQDFCHPTADGHRTIAQALFGSL